MRKYPEVGEYIDFGRFKWQKSNKGYYIDNDAISTVDTEKQGPFILENPETSRYITTSPLKNDPTLFLRFADLTGVDNEFINFANDNGLLKWSVLLSHTKHDKKDANGVWSSNRLVMGDQLSDWRTEHFEMKSLTQIWRWIKDRAIEKLRLVARWTKDKNSIIFFVGAEKDIKLSSIEYVHPSVRTWKLFRGDGSPFSQFANDDVLGPSIYLLQIGICNALKENRVNPVLMADENNRLQPFLHPENLAAAMWFQFYQAVTSESKFKRCEICGKWENVTNKKDSWRRHPSCGGRVRTAQYRIRLEIRKLLAEGISPSDIVNRLDGVTIEQVNEIMNKMEYERKR